MIKVTILPKLGEKCPRMALGHIYCKVENSKYNTGLWKEIEKLQKEIREKHDFESIRHIENIKATREVYKACGKNPHRYRPAAEALYRRIVKGNDLYRINTLVDLINLFSLKSGYSMGAFDADHIVGKVTVGVGERNEPFEGIGKGGLNIEGLPILRDKKGGIGTPTSDEVRTAIRDNTTNLFINVNGYTGKEALEPFMEYVMEMLVEFVKAENIERNLVVYSEFNKA